MTLVTGCDGLEMGCRANYPFARLYICAPALFYLGLGTVCRGWDAVNPAGCPKRSIPVSLGQSASQTLSVKRTKILRT